MIGFLKTFFTKFQPIETLHIAFDSGGKHKPTIILLHGIAASSSTWDNLLKELDLVNNRVIAIDLLGFGKSPKPENCEYSVDDHIKYLRETIKKLKIKGDFEIVGHSMGSIIASRYCLYYPRHINTVFLLSPPIYIDRGELKNILERGRTDFFMNIYKFLSEQKDFTINVSNRLRKLLNIQSGMEVDESTWKSFRLSLMNTIVKQNTYNDIKNLIKPVRIIYGALDEFLIQESIDSLNWQNQIIVTKIPAVDHVIGVKFAKEVAAQISK